MAWTKAPVSKKSAVYKTAQRSSNPPKKKAKPGTIKCPKYAPKLRIYVIFGRTSDPLNKGTLLLKYQTDTL